MRKASLLYKLSLVFLFAAGLQSCKKENGIDNDSVIKKPYGLYVSTDLGSLLNTNDGANYKTIFPPDGFAPRALVTSGENIIWVKGNVHLSKDNGLNFNYIANLNVNNFYLLLTPFLPWQQVIVDAPGHSRVYICSTDGKGIAYSDNHGQTWNDDNGWDVDVNGGGISSLTVLKNGSVFAHSLTNNDSLYKHDPDVNDNWTHMKANTPLPTPALFYINHFNNTLIATDANGANGVYASNDDGINWAPYNGLPNRILYCTNAPFDQVLLVGTDSMGVYRYANGNFVPSNAGLDDNTTVYSIIGKEDIYKNDATKRYVYIATDKGLYRSPDLGQNWTLVKPGRYVNVY